jgi:hypothetical protein
VLQEAPPKESDPPDKVMVELIVCDTGKVNCVRFDLSAHANVLLQGIGQKFLKVGNTPTGAAAP